MIVASNLGGASSARRIYSVRTGWYTLTGLVRLRHVMALEMSKPIHTTVSPAESNRGAAAPVPVSVSSLGRPPAPAKVSQSAGVGDYEQALAQDPRWALSEGSRHFEGKSAVFDALQKIASRLAELQIPYCVVEGMALFHHGVRRFTEDVDILVTKQDLKRIHGELAGRGYLPPHRHSKHLRDTESGVRIEFLSTGDYPGDGRPKPVSFPDPAVVSSASDGISYINLPNLIELKLASGMTNAARLRDVADVMELIKLLNLPAEFAQQLNFYVRDKYAEIWKQAKKKFITIREIERLTPDEREGLHEDGITLEFEGEGLRAGYVRLVTTDSDVARKYDMVEESEFWPEAEGEGAEADER